LGGAEAEHRVRGGIDVTEDRALVVLDDGDQRLLGDHRPLGGQGCSDGDGENADDSKPIHISSSGVGGVARSWCSVGGQASRTTSGNNVLSLAMEGRMRRVIAASVTALAIL